jgi:hypothetical protein
MKTLASTPTSKEEAINLLPDVDARIEREGYDLANQHRPEHR